MRSTQLLVKIYNKHLGWYAEFFLKIVLKFLLGKTSARLNLKIMLNSLHTGSGAVSFIPLLFIVVCSALISFLQCCVKTWCLSIGPRSNIPLYDIRGFYKHFFICFCPTILFPKQIFLQHFMSARLFWRHFFLQKSEKLDNYMRFRPQQDKNCIIKSTHIQRRGGVNYTEVLHDL